MFLVRVKVDGGAVGSIEFTIGETRLFETAREAEQQAAEYIMSRQTNPRGAIKYTVWIEEEVKRYIYCSFQSNNICEEGK